MLEKNLESPLVSIITPSLNQGSFIENTILSVLHQDYPNIEYIIMDGGSVDDSVKIIKKYNERISYWESQADEGQAEAINKGLQRATGKIFTFINSDDFLMPGAVRHMVDMYLAYPEAVAWVGGCHEITKDGYIMNTVFPKKLGRENLAIWQTNWFYQPACFFSAETAKKIGFLDPQYFNALDFDFWLRLSNEGDFIPTTEVIAAATIHAEAKTQYARLNMFKEVSDILLAQGFNKNAEVVGEFVADVERPKLLNRAWLLYISNYKKRDGDGKYIQFPIKSQTQSHDI